MKKELIRIILKCNVSKLLNSSFKFVCFQSVLKIDPFFFSFYNCIIIPWVQSDFLYCKSHDVRNNKNDKIKTHYEYSLVQANANKYEFHP